jgi:hypothetical protein
VIADGATETFELAIAAPNIDVGGGQKYEILLEVVADDAQIPSSFQVVKVSVVPFMRFNLALKPNEITHQRRRQAGIIITNNGNYTETFFIQPQAPDRLQIRPKHSRVDLKPAEFKTIPLIFKPARDAFQEERLLFSVSVSCKTGMTERVNGSYIMKRRAPIRLLPILLVSLIIAVLINWLVFQIEPAAQLEYFLNQVNTVIQFVRDFFTGLRS